MADEKTSQRPSQLAQRLNQFEPRSTKPSTLDKPKPAIKTRPAAAGLSPPTSPLPSNPVDALKPKTLAQTIVNHDKVHESDQKATAAAPRPGENHSTHSVAKVEPTPPRQVATKPTLNAAKKDSVAEEIVPPSKPAHASAAAIVPTSSAVSDTPRGGSGRGRNPQTPLAGATKPNAATKPVVRPGQPLNQSGQQSTSTETQQTSTAMPGEADKSQVAPPPWASQLKKSNSVSVEGNDVVINKNSGNKVTRDNVKITKPPSLIEQHSMPIQPRDENISSSDGVPSDDTTVDVDNSFTSKPSDITPITSQTTNSATTNGGSDKPQVVPPPWASQLKKNKVNSMIVDRNNDVINEVSENKILRDNKKISKPLSLIEQKPSTPMKPRDEKISEGVSSADTTEDVDSSSTSKPSTITPITSQTTDSAATNGGADKPQVVSPPWASQLKKNKVSSVIVDRNSDVINENSENKILRDNKKISKPLSLVEQKPSTPRKPLGKSTPSDRVSSDDTTGSGNEAVNTSSSSKPDAITPPLLQTTISSPPNDVITMAGGKSYRRLGIPDEVATQPPRKPARPPLVDLTAYQVQTGNRHGGCYSDDDGEIYDDVVGVRDVTRPFSTVSRISEFTEEDEIGSRPKQEDFEDEIYQDVGAFEEDGLVYEELDSN